MSEANADVPMLEETLNAAPVGNGTEAAPEAANSNTRENPASEQTGEASIKGQEQVLEKVQKVKSLKKVKVFEIDGKSGERYIYHCLDEKIIHKYRMDTFEDFRRHMNKEEWEAFSNALSNQNFHKNNCSVWGLAANSDYKTAIVHIEAYNVPAICKINGRVVQGTAILFTGLHTKKRYLGRNYSLDLLSTVLRVYRKREGYIGAVVYCPKILPTFERVGFERFAAHSLFYERLLTNRHLQPQKENVELLTMETARKFIVEDATRILKDVYKSEVNMFTMIPEPTKQEYLDAKSVFMAKYFGYKGKYYNGVTLKGTDNFMLWFLDFQRRSFTITKHYITSAENAANLLDEAVNQALQWNFHLLQIWCPSKYFDRRQFNKSCYFEINRSIDVPHLAFFGDWKKMDTVKLVESMNKERAKDTTKSQKPGVSLVVKMDKPDAYDDYLKEIYKNANLQLSGVKVDSPIELPIKRSAGEAISFIPYKNPAKKQRLEMDPASKKTKADIVKDSVQEPVAQRMEGDSHQNTTNETTPATPAENIPSKPTSASTNVKTEAIEVEVAPAGGTINDGSEKDNLEKTNADQISLDEQTAAVPATNQQPNLKKDAKQLKTVKKETKVVDTSISTATEKEIAPANIPIQQHDPKDCPKDCPMHKSKKAKKQFYTGPVRQAMQGTLKKQDIQIEDDEWWQNLKFEWHNNDALFWL
ncbi:hypothetical protein HDV01_000208 [Terramyces sp. JEL0728]|nr:hypothetical protein HDV01_000208 [Terramyces sp. JEL0728]